MKTTVHILFEASEIPGKAEAVLVPAGCGPDVASLTGGIFLANQDGSNWHEAEFINVELDEGDERIGKLIALIESFGQEASVSRTVVYSEEDLQTAHLLKMSAGDDYLQSIALELGTKYDLKQACPHCGTGVKQVWYERVKRKELPKLRKQRAIMSRDGHIIVDATMRKMLVEAGITGISFAEVHARDEVGDWNPIDRDQILIESTMPPMRGELTAEEEQDLCKVCRRGGHPFRSNKRYHKEDLIGMNDINLTWEWFGSYRFDGNVRTSQFSFPLIMVTRKAMNIFREARVTTFKWTPVEIAI